MLFRLLAVLFAALVSLGALEIGLRLTGWERASQHPIGSLYRHHPVLGREHVPGREVVVYGVPFRIDAYGFRDPDDTPPERTPGVTRVALLGDSFAWGWRVTAEEMLSERLEALAGGEVINMGHVAFGTGQEWLVLREKGAAFRPDLVVLAFYVENDFADNLSRRGHKPHFALGDDGRVTLSNVPVPYPLADRASQMLKEHLLSYFFIGQHARLARARLAEGTGPVGRAYRWVGSFRKEKKRRESADLSRLDLFLRAPTEEMERGERLAGALLAEIRDLTASFGGRLLVAVIPAREQVEDERWRVLLDDAPAAQYDRERPTAAALRLCEAAGVPALDLTPALRAAQAAGTQVHIDEPQESHWNAAGHAVAAAAIHRELERLGWLAWARTRAAAPR